MGPPAAAAKTLLEGFNRHYALFRYNAQQAKTRFESGDYQGIRRLSAERIAFYDQRVKEAFEELQTQYADSLAQDGFWQEVRKAFTLLISDHRQPELAETFFNSVTTKLLDREYFRNDILFIRPQVSTDYLDSDPPSYRVYYPRGQGLKKMLYEIAVDVGLACPWDDISRDLRFVRRALVERLERPWHSSPDLQIHVLRGLFYRNKGAYLIGRIINDGDPIGFAVPILRNREGRLVLDTILFQSEQIAVLFSFARSYFTVDMEVPSAYVQFLRTLLPNKPKSELYTMLGLQKQGKTLFYRDLLHHLKHSNDRFRTADGIKGLVMLVFTLPSFPYVFKIIKDRRSKDVSREFIASKYQLVKVHDRAGRMADTWEYSDVAFPRSRFEADLIDEIREFAPSMISEVGDSVVIHHLYIERRMIPLNLFIEHATEQEVDGAVKEYGDAIKQLVGANIFPGDMLYKNFGLTRQRRVVFYDYDEIVYLTDCNFRKIPPPRTPEDEMSAEPWYTVGPHDIFPEEFETFLLGQPRLREAFMRHHANLLDAGYWIAQQEKIKAGILEDVIPYPDDLRFNRYAA